MDIIEELPSQSGRIFIVTGANAGLGFETALALAKKNAKVIMACRNADKANKAIVKIKEEVSQADLEFMQIDLSSMDSVRKYAKEYQSKYDRLDVLINNAGVMMPPYSKTTDGFELQFAANYLAHFLLTGLLLENLLSTPHSRIVSLSSLVHKNGQINFNDLQSEKSYSASAGYSQSKLACLIFAFELQRRLEKAGHATISIAAHPGIADTELSRHFPKFLYYLAKYTIAPFLTHSPKEGAKPTLLAALGQAEGGEYFGPTGFNEYKGKPGKATYTAKAQDKELAEKLWKVSEELVGIKNLEN